jgi:hypothetical protein
MWATTAMCHCNSTQFHCIFLKSHSNFILLFTKCYSNSREKSGHSGVSCNSDLKLPIFLFDIIFFMQIKCYHPAWFGMTSIPFSNCSFTLSFIWLYIFLLNNFHISISYFSFVVYPVFQYFYCTGCSSSIFLCYAQPWWVFVYFNKWHETRR